MEHLASSWAVEQMMTDRFIKPAYTDRHNPLVIHAVLAAVCRTLCQAQWVHAPYMHHAVCVPEGWHELSHR